MLIGQSIINSLTGRKEEESKNVSLAVVSLASRLFVVKFLECSK